MGQRAWGRESGAESLRWRVRAWGGESGAESAVESKSMGQRVWGGESGVESKSMVV